MDVEQFFSVMHDVELRFLWEGFPCVGDGQARVFELSHVVIKSRTQTRNDFIPQGIV